MPKLANVLDTLIERSRRRDIQCRIDGEAPNRTFVVEPADSTGFSVAVTETEEEWIIAFGGNGVHDHVHEANTLLELVALALSDSFRLREIWRGSFWQRGMLERRTDAGWEGVTETGLLFFPFWRGARETIRQNRIICNYSSSSSS